MKILMVLALPAVRTLGAARIQVELADSLRAHGHEVDFLALPDVYPLPPRNSVDAILRAFPRASLPQLKRMAPSYDVIDAVEGCVTANKATLGFDGVLVGRSIGLRTAYERWRADAYRRFPAMRGRLLGRIPHKVRRRYRLWEAHQSRAHADGFFALNAAEGDELGTVMGAARVRTLPLALRDDHRAALAGAAQSRSPDAEPHVMFLGTWDARKGCYDFPRIVRALQREVPGVRFTFLGTKASSEQVLLELGLESNSHVHVVPHFAPEALPEMLSVATAGVFPSYAEGFGFAILEQLAAGIPVVAYDAPGPHDILAPLDDRLLVKLGDIDALTRTLVAAVHGRLISPEACVAHAGRFRWDAIALDTTRAYSAWGAPS